MRTSIMQARPHRWLVAGALIISTQCVVASAGLAEDDQQARVYKANTGQLLPARPHLTPTALLADFLRSRGVSDATARSLRSMGEHPSPQTGMMHLRLEQEVAGLRVHDTYVKAAFTRRGELVHVIESLAPVPAAVSLQTRIDEAKALAIALRTLYPTLRGQIPVTGREGNTSLFAKSTFFYDSPRVERVLIPLSSGTLKPGFLVETWTQHGNRLHEALIDGDGSVLEVENRTNSDSYNIFPDHPWNSIQTVVSGPGAGNAESPVGWLFPITQNSVYISGNNVRTYLDTDEDNLPDLGGSPVADGNFLSVADFSEPPSVPHNQEVAVQNAFYLTNLIHDTLYRHGFTETAGNFQTDNFGKGGWGSDALWAEVQDGSDIENPNMATPRKDGRNPRMQLVLHTNTVLVVDAPASIAGSLVAGYALFGPPLGPDGFTGDVVLVDDGVGTATDACEAITNAMAGKVALIDRGTCQFTVKVKNAQNAGAIAAIIANDDGESWIIMSGTDPSITIPSVSLGQTDGQILRSVPGVHVTARTGGLLPRDGALDSDIPWHEYGHGLTWRMIGGMDGALAGAIGEGMSDVLAIIINENDVVGEYAYGRPEGVRRAPYRDYPLTYGDITGAEIHDDGEVYGAIGWRLFEIFRREGLSKDLLLDYLVDGMNYTPRRPSFEDMRDGILAAVANAGADHDCLIWEAFATYGVGVGARGQNRGPGRVFIRESFATPSKCTP